MSKVLTWSRCRHRFAARASGRMNPLTRLIGYSLLLLLVFLGATLGAQSWLRQQTQRLRAEAIEARREQFDAVLRVMTRPVNLWDETYVRQLGDMIGGTVSLQRE